jgi:hypothetical protein
MGVAAAGGGAVSGPVMAGDGYGTLAAGAVAATCRSAAGLARAHRQDWPLIVSTEQPFSAILPRRLTRSRLRGRPFGSLRSPEAGALTAGGGVGVRRCARGRFDRRRVVSFPRETARQMEEDGMIMAMQHRVTRSRR